MSIRAPVVVIALAVAACGGEGALPRAPELPLEVKVRARTGGYLRAPDPCPLGSAPMGLDRCAWSDDERRRRRWALLDLRGRVMTTFDQAQRQHMNELWRQRAFWAAAAFQLLCVAVAADLSRNLRDPYAEDDLDLRLDEECFARLTDPRFVERLERYIATLRTVCR